MKFEQPKDQIEIEGKLFDVDENGYVHFGDIALDLLRQQSQYASRYVNGKIEGYPSLGDDLRFQGDPSEYHELLIHKDDIQEFIKRVREYKNNRWS
ncbi:MAG: hypothetical protein PHO91_01600 [Patescibacteria group bacterium]|nr:hypothetical protein [Patescibacteria group bacterium]